MTSIIRRISATAIASLALVGSFALGSQAKAGQLQEGEKGTDGQISVRVDMINEGEPGSYKFRVETCLDAKAKAKQTIKASDFTATDEAGTVYQVAAPSEYVIQTRYPTNTSTSYELGAGECVQGELDALDLKKPLKTVNYKGTLIQWIDNTPLGTQGNVPFGQTAKTAQGLSVTLSDLEYRDHGLWTVYVKACSTVDTQFGWKDITFVDIATGQLLQVGNHEGDVLDGDKILPFEGEVKAGECTEGRVSFVTDNGVNAFQVRGLLFIANKTVDSPKTTLPDTGN